MRRYLKSVDSKAAPSLSPEQEALIRTKIRNEWDRISEPEELLKEVIHSVMNDPTLQRMCTVDELDKYMKEEYIKHWPEDLEPKEVEPLVHEGTESIAPKEGGK